MRCFECERQAVGLCRWCFRGQCEIHLPLGLTQRESIPATGCIHQFRELGPDRRAATDR
jgi:hypothetical protein